MSESKNISDFLNGKPQIQPVEQSSLLSRLRTFLPQMEEANQNMPAGATADAFQIDTVEESSSDDSSDSDSDLEDVAKDSESGAESQKSRIEIDLDVFREKNSAVDGRDVSVQDVESLPTAFQVKDSEDVTMGAKKPLIEEI
ncbi:Protein CBG11650 [Caenorhabditis briggsae]|uniref:Uncharacterized protein n=2 Tax=Caenorhabditis briggsae TaxID=6238 RepID=A0AAE9AF96_CAEBR|nr:Protein CBG11650 [Caenorhabditis briggsae]ULT93777.1 hypothetical protein L3Y34_003338 [Caenorhabditis briggsae]UMM27031.1 hypothetical protein L5515_010490 [Caenorhabditis briggsae]CAP30774.1 Protein CBG11650 [Caenorhabditis briggsae]